MFEDDESCTDQSSLAPFHDSWSSAHHARNVSGRLQVMGREYHAPLEAPVMAHKRGERESRAMEQSFTQFDIRHPRNFEPVSTPMGARSGN